MARPPRAKHPTHPPDHAPTGFSIPMIELLSSGFNSFGSAASSKLASLLEVMQRDEDFIGPAVVNSLFAVSTIGTVLAFLTWRTPHAGDLEPRCTAASS